MRTTKKIAIAATIIIATGAMTACSTLRTTVIPQSQNKYTVVATAESGSTAIDGAIKKSQKVCTKQGKKLVVINHKTKYQGAGKTLGTVSSIVSQVAFEASNTYVPSTKGAEDYKSIVNFECQ